MTVTTVTGPEGGVDQVDAPAPRGRARLLVPWIALAAVLAVSLAVVASRSAPDDSVGARAQRLTRELRCPTCQGLSVADSHDPSSEAMRTDVRERIEAGESEDEIRASYVELYGESILLRPEGGGLGVLVWGLPVAVLVAGAGGIVFAVRRGRAGSVAGVPARRFLAVGAVVAVAAASGVLIAITVGDDTPGGAAAEPSGPSRDQRRAALAGAVEASPDDYDARVAYARFLLNDDETYRLEAIRQFDAAAGIDGSRPEPFAYSGWLVALSAQAAAQEDQKAVLLEGAHERIDRAIEINDEYPDAQVFKGLVLFDLEGDAEAAVPYFQRYLQLAPEDDPMREVVLGALAQAVQQSPSTTAPAGGAAVTSTAPPGTTVP